MLWSTSLYCSHKQLYRALTRYRRLENGLNIADRIGVECPIEGGRGPQLFMLFCARPSVSRTVISVALAKWFSFRGFRNFLQPAAWRPTHLTDRCGTVVTGTDYIRTIWNSSRRKVGVFTLQAVFPTLIAQTLKRLWLCHTKFVLSPCSLSPS